MAVRFHQLVTVDLKRKKELKNFIPDIISREGRVPEELDIIFCSDEYLLKINREYLQHDYYTDIITFDISDSKTSPVKGELYISIDRVKDNAKTAETTANAELHRVIFHGILHLCGYKDKSKSDIAQIRNKEDSYLKEYL